MIRQAMVIGHQLSKFVKQIYIGRSRRRLILTFGLDIDGLDIHPGRSGADRWHRGDLGR